MPRTHPSTLCPHSVVVPLKQLRCVCLIGVLTRTVCSGSTNHAEALRIKFDPSIVKYDELVEFFYRTHNPTTVNRQCGDTGTRSAIFYNTPEQLEIAKRVTEEIQAKHFTPKGTT
ncbi:peptide methionine sulfoxide reductase MsrA [Irpex lacteus]|nr:peptide methionine sulfoxide reductase MsrA [Irpex lacteus]